MSNILRLENYFVSSLSIKWHGLKNPDESGTADVVSVSTFDYEAFQNEDDEDEFGLRMSYQLKPADPQNPEGYSIAVDIFGMFRLPGNVEFDEGQHVLRVNGCTILYGILRGEIASAMSSFPGGRYLLPTVNMAEEIQAMEDRRLEHLDQKVTTSEILETKEV